MMLAAVLLGTSGGAALAQPVSLLGPVQATPLPPPRPGTSLPMMPAVTPSNAATALPPLEAAEEALAARRYGLAGQDLEAGETRLLNLDARDRWPGTPGAAALAEVRIARGAVHYRQRPRGLAAISLAISDAEKSDSRPLPFVAVSPPPGYAPVVVGTPLLAPTPPPPPPVPMVTKALLPGHWQEGSWQYHWVPPETRLRPVETRTAVEGQFVFKTGIGWVWVPAHLVK